MDLFHGVHGQSPGLWHHGARHILYRHISFSFGSIDWALVCLRSLWHWEIFIITNSHNDHISQSHWLHSSAAALGIDTITNCQNLESLTITIIHNTTHPLHLFGLSALLLSCHSAVYSVTYPLHLMRIHRGRPTGFFKLVLPKPQTSNTFHVAFPRHMKPRCFVFTERHFPVCQRWSFKRAGFYQK